MLPTPVLRLLNVLDGDYLENEEEYEGQCCGPGADAPLSLPASWVCGEGADCVGSETRSPLDSRCRRPPTLLRQSPVSGWREAGASAAGGLGLGGVTRPRPPGGVQVLVRGEETELSTT